MLNWVVIKIYFLLIIDFYYTIKLYLKTMEGNWLNITNMRQLFGSQFTAKSKNYIGRFRFDFEDSEQVYTVFDLAVANSWWLNG